MKETKWSKRQKDKDQDKLQKEKEFNEAHEEIISPITLNELKREHRNLLKAIYRPSNRPSLQVSPIKEKLIADETNDNQRYNSKDDSKIPQKKDLPLKLFPRSVFNNTVDLTKLEKEAKEYKSPRICKAKKLKKPQTDTGLNSVNFYIYKNYSKISKKDSQGSIGGSSQNLFQEALSNFQSMAKSGLTVSSDENIRKPSFEPVSGKLMDVEKEIKGKMDEHNMNQLLTMMRYKLGLKKYDKDNQLMKLCNEPSSLFQYYQRRKASMDIHKQHQQQHEDKHCDQISNRSKIITKKNQQDRNSSVIYSCTYDLTQTSQSNNSHEEQHKDPKLLKNLRQRYVKPDSRQKIEQMNRNLGHILINDQNQTEGDGHTEWQESVLTGNNSSQYSIKKHNRSRSLYRNAEIEQKYQKLKSTIESLQEPPKYYIGNSSYSSNSQRVSSAYTTAPITQKGFSITLLSSRPQSTGQDLLTFDETLQDEKNVTSRKLSNVHNLDYINKLRKMTQQYRYLDPENSNTHKIQIQSVEQSFEKSKFHKQGTGGIERKLSLKSPKREETFDGLRMIQDKTNIEGIGNSSIVSDRNKDKLYNQFVNHCLIQTTDDFIKARYKVFMKQKKTINKSRFFERMQHDIQVRQDVLSSIERAGIKRLQQSEQAESRIKLRSRANLHLDSSSALHMSDKHSNAHTPAHMRLTIQ